MPLEADPNVSQVAARQQQKPGPNVHLRAISRRTMSKLQQRYDRNVYRPWAPRGNGACYKLLLVAFGVPSPRKQRSKLQTARIRSVGSVSILAKPSRRGALDALTG